MPGVVAAVGVGVLGSLGVTAASAGVIMGAGAVTIGFVTASVLRGARLREPGDGGGSLGGQQTLIRSTIEPRKIGYGECLVSGPIVFTNTATSGSKVNGSLYVVAALLGHEIDAFQGFYLDDKFIPIADINTGGDGEVDQDTNSHGYGPIGGEPVLYLREHLGTSSQTADSMMTSEFSSEWTSDHRLRGVTYIVVRMEKVSGSEEVWQQGPPGNISALVRGKKVYDPRLDSTFSGSWGTGSGLHRVNDPTTWGYSPIPPLCLADYLIDSDLGAGEFFDPSTIDYNAVAIAADECEDAVDIPTASTEQRFECNGVLSCDDYHYENIEKILSSMSGTLRWVNGLWTIAAGMWPSSSSFDLTGSDLVGDIRFDRMADPHARYNSVRGVYFDPERQHKESPYLPVEDTDLQTDRDDGQEIWNELDLPMTITDTMCQRVAFRSVAQASRTGLLVFPMGYRGMDIAAGDRGTVTIDELGGDWAPKSFRCIGLRHVDMVGVELVLKEDDNLAYEDPAEGDYGTRDGATIVTFPKLFRNLSGSGQGQLLADPFFSRSTRVMTSGTDYRNYFWHSIGSHADATVTISPTGGITGDGVVQLTAAAFSGGTKPAELRSIPYEGSLSVAGEYAIVTVRLRRTSASLTTNAANAVVVSAALGSEDGSPGNFGNEPSLTITQTTVAGWTQNQWQQFTFLQQLGLLSLASFSGPYCIVSVTVQSQNEALPIEIDAITVQRTPDPAL